MGQVESLQIIAKLFASWVATSADRGDCGERLETEAGKDEGSASVSWGCSRGIDAAATGRKKLRLRR